MEWLGLRPFQQGNQIQVLYKLQLGRLDLRLEMRDIVPHLGCAACRKSPLAEAALVL